MKKFMLCLIAFVAMFVLASCGEPVVVDLEISGYKTAFVQGDTFDDGDLVVKASYSDENVVDVTSQATVTEPTNMSTPGTYAVLVSFGGITKAYQITVSAKTNTSTLTGINVDSDAADKVYEIGETVSLKDVLVYETYDNTEIDDAIVVVSDLSLSGYTVKVTDMNGNEVNGAFSAFGTYTVTVSKGEYSDSYKVNVGGKVYASVADALAAASENASKVSSGKAVVALDGEETRYTYGFGENYAYTKSEGAMTRYESHFELLDAENEIVNGIDVSSTYSTYYYEWVSSYSKNESATVTNMLGVDFSGCVGYTFEACGIELLINGLYELAITDEVTDLVEGFGNYCYSCGTYHSYEFSFSAFFEYYYYAVEVSFEMDETTNAISSANVVFNGYYDIPEEASAPDFVRTISVSQEMGERNAVNPYPYDSIGYTSFDLVDNNFEPITENTVLEVIVGDNVFVTIANALPETAIPELNEFKVSVVDDKGNTLYNYSDYNYEISQGELGINFTNPGTYTVTVSCGTISKSFKAQANYAELTDFEVTLLTEFGYPTYETSTKVYVGTPVYFGVQGTYGADLSATVALKEANENVTIDYDAYAECYVFYTEEVGTYTVVVTSTVNSDLNGEITVTVEEAPSIAEILSGSYSANNSFYGNVTIEFTPESEGALRGTATYNIPGDGVYVEADSGTITYEWFPAFNTLNAQTTGDYSIIIDTATYSLKLCLASNGYPLDAVELVKGGSSEGEEDNPVEAITVLASTTPMNPTFLEATTATYTTTIGGGNSGCFGIFGDTTDLYITISSNCGLTLYAGSPMAPIQQTYNSPILVPAGDAIAFWFDNSANLTDITIVFTITVVQ